MDRRRGLPRRRVPADAVDALALARRHSVRRRSRSVRRSCSSRPRSRTVAWRRARRRGARGCRARARRARSSRPPDVAGATKLAWQLLLAWIALRYLLLALEVTWQPLYPWDAWIQWATKARVWYEQGAIVPFARSVAWFAADGGVWFDASPEYPPTVPLLQVWACIALGRWDDALMNWPWWQFSRRAHARRLRRAARRRARGAARARRHVPRRIAAARERPRRARRLRRPADGRVLHRCRARAPALDAVALAARRGGRAVPRRRLHADQDTRARLGADARAGRRRRAAAAARAPLRRDRVRRRAVRARRARADEHRHPQLPAAPRLRSRVARARRDATSCSPTGTCSGTRRSPRRSSPGASSPRPRSRRSPPSPPPARCSWWSSSASPTRALWVTEQTTINRATLHVAPLAAVFAVLAFRAFAARFAALRTAEAAPAGAAPPAA